MTTCHWKTLTSFFLFKQCGKRILSSDSSRMMRLSLRPALMPASVLGHPDEAHSRCTASFILLGSDQAWLRTRPSVSLTTWELWHVTGGSESESKLALWSWKRGNVSRVCVCVCVSVYVGLGVVPEPYPRAAKGWETGWPG